MIDLQNMFSNAQAITVDAISERVIDLDPNASPNTTRDIAAGDSLYLHVVASTAFTTSDAGTLTVSIESDSTANLATSATVHATVASAVAATTMVAGYFIVRNFALPAGSYERYLGLRYTTNTGDFTAGNVKAWLTPDKMDTVTYESGVSTGIN